jgi:DNA-3-methyladenine glycosylase
MKPATSLPRDFYSRPTLQVAQQLLGTQLNRILDGVRLAGIIIETEAYIGEDDLGCHARAGKTKRTVVMYGPPGHAYVYFTYGMHWMLNTVTEREGFPAAVLIRAMKPAIGINIISARRNGRDTAGPAKLTNGLGIDGSLNGVDLCDTETGLWIEEGFPISAKDIITSPRVGLENVPEPWKSKPWRFRFSPSGFPTKEENLR